MKIQELHIFYNEKKYASQLNKGNLRRKVKTGENLISKSWIYTFFTMKILKNKEKS